MMKPRERGRPPSPRPLQKVTLNLYRGDWAKLTKLHGPLSAGRAIRLLVRKHIKTVAKVARHEFSE